MRVHEDVTLSNSTDVNKLLVDNFRISMETTGVDESCINGNNEIKNIIIHNILIAVLLESNQHENKW